MENVGNKKQTKSHDVRKNINKERRRNHRKQKEKINTRKKKKENTKNHQNPHTEKTKTRKRERDKGGKNVKKMRERRGGPPLPRILSPLPPPARTRESCGGKGLRFCSVFEMLIFSFSICPPLYSFKIKHKHDGFNMKNR